MIDNDVYDRDADKWRDPNHFLSMLVPLALPRVRYVRQVLEQAQLRPESTQVLDVGCGGGLVAEEMVRLGYSVAGVDPSARSIAAARAHAGTVGLAIEYKTGSGESLPYDARTFDSVYCLDVLEHVDDVDRVVDEIERVLKPGGLFVFDTINRTFRSKLLAINLLQEWPATRVMPPNLHEWNKFIKPAELTGVLRRHGLALQEFVGISMRGNPLSHVRMLRKHKRGLVNFADLGRYLAERLVFGSDMSVSYAGFARKPS